MQFTAITTLFALAAVAIAAPTEIQARTGNPPTGISCPNEQPNQVCCSGTLGLNCVIPLVGETCSGSSFCCNNNVINPQGGLINVNLNLLNCVNVL
ncbi:hypothetical protein F5Y05DRAFT_104256 [Hypoxylon sp. FL0543]|nr:hypothetical protein F5Y05DRAFT_104256 [Hypoxylon sp. FL0543]